MTHKLICSGCFAYALVLWLIFTLLRAASRRTPRVCNHCSCYNTKGMICCLCITRSRVSARA